MTLPLFHFNFDDSHATMTKNNYNNTGILKSVSGNSRSSGYSQSEDTTNASFDDDTFDSDDEKNSALLQEIRSSAQGPNPTTSVTPDRLNGLNIQSNQRNYSERRRLHERILHERNTQVDSVVVPSELANHDETAAAMNYIWMMRSLKRNNRMDRRALLSQQAPSFMARSIASIASSFQSYESTRGKGDLIVEGTPLMSGKGSNSPQKLTHVDEEDAIPKTAAVAIYNIFFGKGILSWCLLAGPISLWAVHFYWSATWIFWLNFVVMLPLAAILGEFTEEIALHTNDVTGGLINASFGNAVEVVVAMQALAANEIRVVQASMLGSIFSNLLLVLGSCFFFGGLYHKEQSFNTTAATANIGLLALSSIALVLPTPFAEYYELHDEHTLIVGRIAAIYLLFMYLQLLVFQLHTHAHMFNRNDDNDAQLASMSLVAACVGLCIVTLLVTLFSNFLVGSIEGFTEASGVSRTFVGLIILPIVGNAVEHVSAVSVATKNKMDLAMGIAVGSCTQISLFVVPLTVLFGWAIGKDMTLNFPHFEVVLYVLSVFTVSVVCSNPNCNWLSGSLLITTYCLIAVGFWFEHLINF